MCAQSADSTGVTSKTGKTLKQRVVMPCTLVLEY